MKDELQNELRKMLACLPDAPVASNFTARVMQAVELEDAREAHSRGWNWNWRSLLPRVAVAAAVVMVAGVSFQRYQANAHREEIAKTVALVASAKSLPSVDALNNFDAIQSMGQPAHADEELLATLQ